MESTFFLVIPGIELHLEGFFLLLKLLDHLIEPVFNVIYLLLSHTLDFTATMLNKVSVVIMHGPCCLHKLAQIGNVLSYDARYFIKLRKLVTTTVLVHAASTDQHLAFSTEVLNRLVWML